MVTPPTPDKSKHLGNLSAIGAVSGGVLASSCCLLPVLFISLGLGGAWIGNLQALAPYQPYFFGLAVVSIGAGFWLSKNSTCTIDGDCAPSSQRQRYKIGLWVGTGFIVALIAYNLLWSFF